MKKRITIPLLCLCVALLFAGGLALLIPSGLSLADAIGVLLEKPFEDWGDLSDGTRDYEDPAESLPHEHIFVEEEFRYCDCGLYGKLENGGYTVREYDPDHRWLLTLETEYDAEGNAVKVTRYEYEYENPGDMEPKHTYVYENDVLIYEENRAVKPEVDPEHTYRECISYEEDGGRTVSLYKFDHKDYIFYYDAEGELTKTERFVNTYDAKGRLLGQVHYVNGLRVYEYLNFKSPEVRWYRDYEIFYDEKGDPEQHYDWEYTYDEWGEPTHFVKTLNGAVIEETFYGDEYGYGQYARRVITYGENGQVLTDIYYDPEGNEISP
jgi:hypothetical protein